MLTPDQKGTIAEAEIVAAAARLHLPVLKPLNDGLRYDVVFDLGRRFHRVQCKWAVRRGEVVLITCRTSRRTRAGHVRTMYTREEVDLVIGYCADTDCCYALVPDVFERYPIVSLRLAPTRNNQRQGVRWARDYEMDRLDWGALGAVAQLGERRAGSA